MVSKSITATVIIVNEKNFQPREHRRRTAIPVSNKQNTKNMTKEDYEKARIARERITNPPPPPPQTIAVRVIQGGKMCAGAPRQAGEMLMLWPDTPPSGFITKEQARDLIEMGMCTMATDEEIEAFLTTNNQPTNQ
jgi:hypothetical protein